MKKLKSFSPPGWLVSVVWVIGFSIVWTIIAALFWLAGSGGTKFPFLHDIINWTFSPYYDGLGIGIATAKTMLCFVQGFVVGVLIGVLFAILMYALAPVKRVGYPILLLSQMIPMLGLAPIIVSMVGDFENAKLVMAAYMTFFPVAANLFAGFSAIDSGRKELMVMLGATPIVSLFKLILPASLPSLFTGLKLAAPTAFAAVIFTEVLYPQNGGIGGEILNTQYGNDWELCWGYIFMAVIVAVALFYAVGIVEKLVIRWKTSD